MANKKQRRQLQQEVTEPQEKQLKTVIGNNRVIAAIIDWLIGGVFSGLPGVIAFARLTNSNKTLTSLYQFEAMGFKKEITLLVALCCLLFAFFYYVVVPWKIWPGQTLGKHWLHLKIVSLDERQLHFGDYFLRQFIFLLFVEGIATACSIYIKVIITTATRFYVDSYLNIAWSIITFISIYLLFGSKKHLSLHDHVVKTTVIAVTDNN